MRWSVSWQQARWTGAAGDDRLGVRDGQDVDGCARRVARSGRVLVLGRVCNKQRCPPAGRGARRPVRAIARQRITLAWGVFGRARRLVRCRLMVTV